METKKNSPEIRFKGFEGEWEETEISNIFEIIDGDRGINYPGESDFFESGHTLFLDTGNVKKNGFNFENKKYITKTNDNLLRSGKLKLFDFVLTSRGTLGNVAYYNKNVCKLHPSIRINSAMLILRPIAKDTIIDDYMNSVLTGDTIENFMSKNHVGSAQPHITKRDFSKLIIDFPNDVIEQTQIGTYFQNLDSLISLHQRKYDKLLTVKKAMLEKMFPKEGADLPEIRFKEFEGKWEKKRLGEIAIFAKGQGYSKNDLIGAGCPIILYGRLYTKYETVISEVDTFVIEHKDSIYSKGIEVIVPASGETAEDISRASAVIKPGIILGGDLNIIYPNEIISSVFLALSISNGNVQKDLSTRAQGKSVVHLRNNDLKEVVLIYPNIEEQTKIGTFFQNLDNLITQHQKELVKLKNLKKGCLEKMFV